MTKETDVVRRNTVQDRPLDAADRRLLSALVDDATVSYAELGEKANLSAPAAHERVKRLRRKGVIRRTSALLDPHSVGKPLLAFVHVDTQGWGKTPNLMKLSALPEIEDPFGGGRRIAAAQGARAGHAGAREDPGGDLRTAGRRADA